MSAELRIEGPNIKPASLGVQSILNVPIRQQRRATTQPHTPCSSIAQLNSEGPFVSSTKQHFPSQFSRCYCKIIRPCLVERIHIRIAPYKNITMQRISDIFRKQQSVKPFFSTTRGATSGSIDLLFAVFVEHFRAVDIEVSHKEATQN
jgi:hypothetical protein